MDLGICKLENDLISNYNNKNNEIYGSIPYIPPEVLRGNEFTTKGDIYSFGGIMYEIVTAQRPFADQAHDTYLMIDICNGVRPKVPDFMLNWIPEWYLDLMYQCWSDDPSERPTNYFHIQISYILNHVLSTDRNIHTLHGLHDLLEDLKSGKSSSNESTISSVNTHNIDGEIRSDQKIDIQPRDS
ncbi:hypothetical protein Glove_84g124 [Diversispora epigaea]|uniref:Protein kinase domain-containing protein n=1 Tax=Diversispora epigaea TaxID=1348612 RepID=A0A397JHY2_9GLOM|nr:hypothetical protein Glove_84g124 [Diversispora epigaea]